MQIVHNRAKHHFMHIIYATVAGFELGCIGDIICYEIALYIIRCKFPTVIVDLYVFIALIRIFRLIYIVCAACDKLIHLQRIAVYCRYNKSHLIKFLCVCDCDFCACLSIKLYLYPACSHYGIFYNIRAVSFVEHFRLEGFNTAKRLHIFKYKVACRCCYGYCVFPRTVIEIRCVPTVHLASCIVMLAHIYIVIGYRTVFVGLPAFIRNYSFRRAVGIVYVKFQKKLGIVTVNSGIPVHPCIKIAVVIIVAKLYRKCIFAGSKHFRNIICTVVNGVLILRVCRVKNCIIGEVAIYKKLVKSKSRNIKPCIFNFL